MELKRVESWVGGVLAGVCLLTHGVANGGVHYLDPMGGWRYTYDGNFNEGVADIQCLGGVCPPGYGRANDQEALDGTWQHDQGDKWDGSGPGDIGPAPNGPAPGGAASLQDGDTTYMRLQDAGNPELEGHGWIQANQDPINNNRRVFFGRRLEIDGALASERVLDDGITISVRMRLPVSGPLHNIYGADDMGNAVIRRWFDTHPADYNQDEIVNAADFTVWRDTLGSTYDLRADADDGSGTGTPNGIVDQADYDYWVANFGATAERIGRGHPIHNDGRGMFNVVQNDLDFFNLDGSVGFTLMSTQDIALLCQGTPDAPICEDPAQSGGLVMNNLVGTSPSSQVDTIDQGTLNLLEIDDSDLAEWREFWITIEEDGTIGTHTVNVYMDGSTAPTTFHVTTNTEDDSTYGNDAWLTMGLNDSDYFGSFDLDFYSYTLGVIPPVASAVVPEPLTNQLLMSALIGWWLCGPRLRSGRVQ